MDHGVSILIHILWTLDVLAVCASAVLIAYRKFESDADLVKVEDNQATLLVMVEEAQEKLKEVDKLRTEVNQLKTGPAPRPRF